MANPKSGISPSPKTHLASAKAGSKSAAQPAAPAPAAAAAAAPAPAEEAALSPDDAVRQLKRMLQATREKLMLVSPDMLSDADHDAWTQQIFEVSTAINRLRNVALQNLSAQFTAELPGFEAAASQLAADLERLQKATEVIKAVAGALGVIGKIVTLLG